MASKKYEEIKGLVEHGLDDDEAEVVMKYIDALKRCIGQVCRDFKKATGKEYSFEDRDGNVKCNPAARNPKSRGGRK